MVCLFALLSYSDLNLQSTLPTNDNNNVLLNSTTAISSTISYKDTRPIAPNGYLCIYGSKGRLNNKILHNLVGIYMANHLNRTFLVDDEVSKYYDVDRLSLTTYGESPHMAAMAITSSNYTTCGNPTQLSPYALNHGMNIIERFNDYHKQTKDKHIATVDNNDAWYWLGRPPESIYQKFFAGLIPRKIYQDKAIAFMNKYNLNQVDNPYNALHLRYYEGKCGNFDTDLCCPKLDYVHEILVERDGNINSPLFIANDGQCPKDVLESYSNTSRTIIMGYNETNCDGTECAVLDFELCIHAEIFVGNMKSSGDCNIREWRVARYDKGGTTSVLSRNDPEVKAMEGRTKFMTRYILGHWRFRPDCNSVGGRERSKPCM